MVEKLAVWASDPSSTAPKARVLLVHGMSEHSGRHQNTESILLNAGFSVVRFDLRGAGQSGGRRQWIEKFDDYLDDLSVVYRWIVRELPPLPLFLFGHSLGGAIALSFLEHYQKAFVGCVLSAPAFQLGGAINPIAVALGRQVVKFLPTIRISGNSDKSAISRDPEVVKSFLEDPLCCHTNTANQGKEILDQLPKLARIAPKVTLPVLFVHGSSDKIVRLEGSFELMQKCSSLDRSLFIIPGGYHEAHNDLGKEEYFEHLVFWLNRQLVAFSLI